MIYVNTCIQHLHGSKKIELHTYLYEFKNEISK
jgi:hypothetical protein